VNRDARSGHLARKVFLSDLSIILWPTIIALFSGSLSRSSYEYCHCTCPRSIDRMVDRMDHRLVLLAPPQARAGPYTRGDARCSQTRESQEASCKPGGSYGHQRNWSCDFEETQPGGDLYLRTVGGSHSRRIRRGAGQPIGTLCQ